MVTRVVPATSFLEGQETFFISAFTSLKKVFTFSNHINFILKTGQEGVEPPASGFGDRRSAWLSYWPFYLTSLWSVCFLQNLQNFFISNLDWCFFLFFVVE